MKLISAPITRRLKSLDIYRNIPNITLITDINHDLNFATICFPNVEMNIYQKILFKIKKLLDYKARHDFHRELIQLNEFHYYLAALLIEKLGIIIDKVIIHFFKNYEFDNIVTNCDSVDLYTFNFATELFLYSSANRLNKTIIFNPDGWDTYSSKYIPYCINCYNIWGAIDYYYLEKKFKYFEYKLINCGFKKYERLQEKSTLVIYEGTKDEVPKNVQIDVINQLVKLNQFNGSKLIFKKLHGSQSVFTNEELNLLGCTVFESSSQFSDIGKNFNTNNDDLSKLIPDSLIFIGFNSTHGYLEFGLNDVHVFGVITLKNYRKTKLINELEMAGVLFLDSFQTIDDKFILNVLSSNLDFSRIISE